MIKLKLSGILLAVAIVFSSCEEEVDLFTEGDETPVVFAMLEPSNPIQYFRINPTFIGEGDARDLASDHVITSYGAGEIEAKLIDLTSDTEFLLKDTLDIKLDSDGIFNPDNNRLFYLKTDVKVLSDGTIDNKILIPGHEYQLHIKNVKTGVISSSTIELGDINKLLMAFPRKGLSQFPRDWMQFFGTEYNKSYTFEFDADVMSERFLIDAKYYYTEDAEDKDSKDKYITFNIGERNEVEAFNSNSKRIAIEFDGERFYKILETKFAEYPERTGQTFDLMLTAVGRDLDIYVSVQDASLSGLSQEKPSYSNIENGLGVFSYRLNKTFAEFKLNQSSAQHVHEGSYSRDRFKCARFGTQNNSLGEIDCR